MPVSMPVPKCVNMPHMDTARQSAQNLCKAGRHAGSLVRRRSMFQDSTTKSVIQKNELNHSDKEG
jgi:hypothetical protein